jgi:hypothetical protein
MGTDKQSILWLIKYIFFGTLYKLAKKLKKTEKKLSKKLKKTEKKTVKKTEKKPKKKLSKNIFVLTCWYVLTMKKMKVH